MDNLKNIITGGVITLFIGGAAFTFSQQDVINNLAEDTGITQEQAEQYINDIPEEELASWEEIGSDFVTESGVTLGLANDIDCVNYEYEWESASVTCFDAKAHVQSMANTEKLLGQAFMKLTDETGSKDDMRTVISYLDQLNTHYQHEISVLLFDREFIDEMVMTNSYNKSILKAALESE